MLTEAHWEEAHRGRERTTRVIAAIGVLGLGLLAVPAAVVAVAVHGGWRYPAAGLAAVLLGLPFVTFTIRAAERRQSSIDTSLRDMSRRLHQAVSVAEREVAQRDAQAGRQQFESRVANALDMATGEPEVLGVIERSLEAVLPGSPAELLLADNSQAHLVRTAAVGSGGGEGGCPVDSPANCPAARRAQTQVFADSNDLDACPKLRNRGGPGLSALCVPVSIMGRTVGVIHSTTSPPAPAGEDQVSQLAILAKLAGARLGMLRAMAESQLQASTDSLTGLLNRRSFERKVAESRRSHRSVTLAMADLDHFKELNDTYGHETGDRALRLFARVLRESLRDADVVCRYGGEEFAIALPSCPVEEAERVFEAVRTNLEAAVTVGGLPRFTVSIGVSDLEPGEELPKGLGRADRALFRAKHQGRNRVVTDGAPTGPRGQVLRGREFELTTLGDAAPPHPSVTDLTDRPPADPGEGL